MNKIIFAHLVDLTRPLLRNASSLSFAKFALFASSCSLDFERIFPNDLMLDSFPANLGDGFCQSSVTLRTMQGGRLTAKTSNSGSFDGLEPVYTGAKAGGERFKEFHSCDDVRVRSSGLVFDVKVGELLAEVASADDARRAIGLCHYLFGSRTTVLRSPVLRRVALFAIRLRVAFRLGQVIELLAFRSA